MPKSTIVSGHFLQLHAVRGTSRPTSRSGSAHAGRKAAPTVSLDADGGCARKAGSRTPGERDLRDDEGMAKAGDDVSTRAGSGRVATARGDWRDRSVGARGWRMETRAVQMSCASPLPTSPT